MKTTVLLDHEPVADGGFLVRALLRIEGDPPPTDGRAPLNLSLVLDRSGSMTGDKLVAARKAAAMLVRRLSPEDTVSVVAYDDRVDVTAAPATGASQEDLPRQIGTIRAGGMTNLSGGWLRGRDLVADNLRDGGVNRILLLTDGLANVGITDPDQLVGLSRTGAEAGISTTTIGFGQDFDEDLLRAMADAGRGGTYYVETVDQASGIFEEELEGLLSLAAQNVRVQVTPGEDADFVRVLHDYPSHADGNILTLEVGDLYAREPRRVLMEFLLPPEANEVGDGEAGAPADVALIRLAAHVMTADGGVELHEIDLPLTLSPVEGGKAEPEVRREILLMEAARVREQALEARDRGDYIGGHNLLRAAANKLRALGVDDDALREEAEDLEAMEDSFVRRYLSLGDIKYMKQRAYSNLRSSRESLRRYRRKEE
jgi:Ca-activated chloride channel family protein